MSWQIQDRYYCRSVMIVPQSISHAYLMKHWHCTSSGRVIWVDSDAVSQSHTLARPLELLADNDLHFNNSTNVSFSSVLICFDPSATDIMQTRQKWPSSAFVCQNGRERCHYHVFATCCCNLRHSCQCCVSSVICSANCLQSDISTMLILRSLQRLSCVHCW